MKRHEDEEIFNELSPEAVQNQVERILSSEKFARSKRLRSLLRFTVQQTLQGHADTLKEYVIGTEVLKKPDSYDPRRDSLVRVLASRLRVKLKEYYNDGGSDDPLVIEFPKGKYVPRFQRREQLQTEMEKKLRARNASSQGKFLLTRLSEQTLAEAAHHFEEAIEADPSWPAAHEGLAMVRAIQGFLGLRRPREVWPQVRTQSEAALHLDEMSAEAHLGLGLFAAFYEWRWREAESHFQKAIERDWYSGGGHLWHALGSLLPLGKTAEAHEELMKARELAPAPFLDEGCALALYLSGRYEEVLNREERRWAGRPMAAFTEWTRACALVQLGRKDEALAILQRAYSEAPRDARLAAALVYLYGIAGQADRGREILKGVEARREQGEWIPNYTLAVAHTGLGDHPEALAAIQDAVRDREAWVVYLQLDARFRPLHDNPKFAGFVRRVFMTEQESGSEQNETPNLVERRSEA
ncbi:MAG TPA: tetratricopeptide repeat protein [Bryobacteraceae bacterium]|jgi:tetratricopeptide (TPR) repeat protein|nr:tetratricopeptide repeat protein [Bryobacteraceae bacterium]